MEITEEKREYNRQYWAKNKERLAAKHQEWLKANPANASESFKRRYHADIEASRAKSRAAYQRSLEKNAKRVRKLKRIMAQKLRDADPEYQDKYRAYRATRKEHYREYIKTYMKEYRKKHPIKTKRALKKSYQKNPIPWFEASAKRRAIKANAQGSHRHSEWLVLLEQHNFLCHYCKRPITTKTASRDHVVPLSKGGGDGIDNIVPACRPCNGRKYVMSAEDFRKTITSTP